MPHAVNDTYLNAESKGIRGAGLTQGAFAATPMRMGKSKSQEFARPFLKWAGGKYRLVERILAELPAGARLVEPFAGSAALFLNAPFGRALVCDRNRDLIDLFRCIQEEGEDFIAYCREFFRPETNTAEAFQDLRARFNAGTDAREKSALLLYLNRHGFNGLVRYNSRGLFNVPFGRYARPYFPEVELRAFRRKTQQTDVTFASEDFRAIFARLRPGDVVYCDPPYVPLSATARFTAYTGDTFGPEDQNALAALAREASGRGIAVIISNHDTEHTRALYRPARLERFLIPRCISCNGAGRTPAPELLAVYG